MRTVTTIITLTLLTVFTSANAQFFGNKKVKGNRDITTTHRTTGSYDKISARGNIDVLLIEGKEGDITIKAESNFMEYIVTETRENTLVIKVKNGVSLRPSRNKNIEVTVPYRDITAVSVSGSGKVEGESAIKSDTFKTKVSGSGDVILSINANVVEAAVSGSGDISLTGTTTIFKAKVSGSGDVEADSLKAKEVYAAVSGSGDISANATNLINGKVMGSGDITYSGSPQKRDTKVSGSGSIRSK
ncbi:head GIN domain-containing protein [Aquimarina hainanensis]|uniref:Head GIN domain-containing protein n=1 Tax=Aquimarina hainanensis TaxID=1578017 RepID=A0ABW5NCC7_9FLAO